MNCGSRGSTFCSSASVYIVGSAGTLLRSSSASPASCAQQPDWHRCWLAAPLLQLLHHCQQVHCPSLHCTDSAPCDCPEDRPTSSRLGGLNRCPLLSTCAFVSPVSSSTAGSVPSFSTVPFPSSPIPSTSSVCGSTAAAARAGRAFIPPVVAEGLDDVLLDASPAILGFSIPDKYPLPYHS